MKFMTTKMRRARWAVAALALTAMLAGCNTKDQLLAPQNPGLIDPTAVTTPTAALALRVGALSRYKQLTNGNGTEALWQYAGTLADEYKNADFLTDRVDIDRRSIDPANGIISGQSATYAAVTQSRGFVRDAISAMQSFLPDSASLRGELWSELGFLEVSLADNFCNGIPLGHTINGVQTFGTPLTTSQVYDSASAHLDSALALSTATDANSVAIHDAALIIKARILVDKGQFAAAAALLGPVPTSYQYTITFSSTGGGSNGIWSLVNSTARVTVSDSVDVVNGALTPIKNALPFVSAADPRVPTINGKIASPSVGAEDTQTPVFLALLYKNQFDPFVLVSGIDARLIEAEAKLNANDIAGMMTILNALRTSKQTIGTVAVPALSALPAPADQTSATTLLFREKAFWTFGRGQRLPDLRRLIRQYKRTEDQVFPSGPYFKGGVYGHDVNLPVPNSEEVNPLFHGCIDRNA
jgi:starch-binding outer membrane protein, SusD/RagB family